jgi:hypothetical protein
MPHLSMYSARYMAAGEFFLLRKQLAPAELPSDFWEHYMGMAGRSGVSNSYKTYVNAYTAAYGPRLRYITDHAGVPGRMALPMRSRMMGW